MWVSIYLYICIIHIRTCADKYMLDSVEERRKQVIISNVLILLIFSCNHQQFSCKEIRTSPKFSKNNWTSSLSRFDFHTNSFDAYPTINSWVPQKRSIFFPIDSPKFTPEERILREKNAVLLEPLSYAVVKDHLTGAVGTWDFFSPRKHGDVGHQNWGISQRLEQLDGKMVCFLGHQKLDVFRAGLRTSPAKNGNPFANHGDLT